MAIDHFSGQRDDQDDPIEHAFAITPSDTELTNATRAIYVGTGGNLVCRFLGDSADVTLSNLVSGVYPFRLKFVRATSTASGLIGLR